MGLIVKKINITICHLDWILSKQHHTRDWKAKNKVIDCHGNNNNDRTILVIFEYPVNINDKNNK